MAFCQAQKLPDCYTRTSLSRKKSTAAKLGFLSPRKTRYSFRTAEAILIEDPPAQFRTLQSWISVRSDELIEHLGRNFILFLGERLTSSTRFATDQLPDWFLGFDIYDCAMRRFFSAERRDTLLSELHLFSVPRISTGHFSMIQVLKILEESHSAFGPSKVEGLYLRRDSAGWLQQRAKVVRAEFTQGIIDDWSRRAVTRNRVVQ